MRQLYTPDNTAFHSKVFFYCDPNADQALLSALSALVLRYQPCSLFCYDEEDLASPQSRLAESLRTMNLLVVPLLEDTVPLDALNKALYQNRLQLPPILLITSPHSSCRASSTEGWFRHGTSFEVQWASDAAFTLEYLRPVRDYLNAVLCSEALAHRIQNRAEETPAAQAYLEGMARFHGVGSVISRQAAYVRLHTAAEASSTEAMEQLAYMGWYELGIHRRSSEAAAWLRKAVSLRRQDWLAHPDRDPSAYIRALSVLCQILSQTGQHDAEECCRELFDVCSRQCSSSNSVAARKDLIAACWKLSDFLHSDGVYQKHGFLLLRQLIEETGSPEARDSFLSYCQSCEDACLYPDFYRIQKAAFAQKQAWDQPSQEAFRQLCYAFLNLRLTIGCRDSMSAALVLAQELVRQEASIGNLWLLHAVYSKLEELQSWYSPEELRSFPTEIDCKMAQLQIEKDLVALTHEERDRCSLFYSLSQLLYNKDSFPLLADWMARNEDCLRLLTEEPLSPVLCANYAAVFEQCAATCRKCGKISTAILCLKHARDLYRSLANNAQTTAQKMGTGYKLDLVSAALSELGCSDV